MPEMIRKPRLMDVDAANFDMLPCCGIKSPAHPGSQDKWAAERPPPTRYFPLIYNGRLLADHQISRARFRNIMAKCVTSGLGPPQTS